MNEEDLPIEARMDIWRTKALAGTLTLEQAREAVRVMRAGRVGASVASAKSKEAKAPIDSGGLLDKLMDL